MHKQHEKISLQYNLFVIYNDSQHENRLNLCANGRHARMTRTSSQAILLGCRIALHSHSSNGVRCTSVASVPSEVILALDHFDASASPPSLQDEHLCHSNKRVNATKMCFRRSSLVFSQVVAVNKPSLFCATLHCANSSSSRKVLGLTPVLGW
jgi:hypothetical protein